MGGRTIVVSTPGRKPTWRHTSSRWRNLQIYFTNAVVVTHPAYLRGLREHIDNHDDCTTHVNAVPTSKETKIESCTHYNRNRRTSRSQYAGLDMPTTCTTKRCSGHSWRPWSTANLVTHILAHSRWILHYACQTRNSVGQNVLFSSPTCMRFAWTCS